MHFVRKMLGILLAPWIKGSSQVDQENNLAIKSYQPRLLMRLIYLFFSLTWWSPYESQKGMRRADILREIANHIGKFRIERPIFAEPHGSSLYEVDGVKRPVLMTRWIDGPVAKRKLALEFLARVEPVLFKAGLHTWSVSSKYNPMAINDVFWQSSHNRPICVDYEALLPPVFVGFQEHQRMARRHKFWPLSWPFPIDYVDFELLRKEVEAARREGYAHYQDLVDWVNKLKSSERDLKRSRRRRWKNVILS